MNCKYAEILSFWTEVDIAKSRSALSTWSNDENFSSVVTLPDSNQVAVYHYVLLGGDGITLQNLIENIEYFATDFDDVGKLLVKVK